MVSHRVGLTLALIQLILQEPDRKCCRLLSCRWKHVWHTCRLFSQLTTNTSCSAFLSDSLLLVGSHKLSTHKIPFYNLCHRAPSSTNKMQIDSFRLSSSPCLSFFSHSFCLCKQICHHLHWCISLNIQVIIRYILFVVSATQVSLKTDLHLFSYYNF